MKKKRPEKKLMTVEETRALYFETRDPEIEAKKMRDAIFKRHWHNADIVTTAEQLSNLLRNHVRLYRGEPSGNGFVGEPDQSIQRVTIIHFLKNRLKAEYPDEAQALFEELSLGRDYALNKDEFAYWQSRIENSRFQWTEDEIFRLNKRGAFYYHGGEEGIYIKIHKDGKVEAGTYEGAFPHIGEAFFTVVSERQCVDYSEAFKVAMEAGGKKFLLDMFSADVVPPPTPAEKPSVLDQIKAARENPAPRQPRADTPDKTRHKGGPEL